MTVFFCVVIGLAFAVGLWLSYAASQLAFLAAGGPVTMLVVATPPLSFVSLV